MRLITLHRILVATSIAFCAFFTWRQIQDWRASGAARPLLIAIAFALVTAALTWYLTNLRRFVDLDARDRPADGSPR